MCEVALRVRTGRQPHAGQRSSGRTGADCILRRCCGPPTETQIAAAFGLGAARSLTGPVARGEEGQVWRLETAAGTWAVKETFDPLDAADVAEIATFQEAAAAAGVATPPVVRTPPAAVARTVAGTQVRVYGWVDLLPPTASSTRRPSDACSPPSTAPASRARRPSTRGTRSRSARLAGTSWPQRWLQPAGRALAR